MCQKNEAFTIFNSQNKLGCLNSNLKMFGNDETQHSECLIASKLDNISEKMKKYQNVLRNYNQSMEKVKETMACTIKLLGS